LKPQNLLLTREDESDPNSKVVVKLGDLGLGAKSLDHSKDISQFVMTVFCMATGEQFGAHKLNTLLDGQGHLRPDFLEDLLQSLTQLTSSPGAGPVAHPSPLSLPCAAAAAEGTGIGRGRVHSALCELPNMVRSLCEGRMAMAEVRDSTLLQGWSLSDTDNADS